MKFVCTIEEVRDAAPEMYCVEKKQAISQKFIIDFMNLACITEEQKAAMRSTIKTERAADPQKYMKKVRDAFLDSFYRKVEVEAAKKQRPQFEDKF